MKEFKTDFALAVLAAKRAYMQAYHRLTARIPRVLPSDEQATAKLKQTLVTYYAVKDVPTSWYIIASEMMGTPRTKTRRSYQDLANVAKRLDINQACQDLRVLAGEQIQSKLEEKAKEIIVDESFKEGLNGDHRLVKPEGWSDVQIRPPDPERVV